jgi:hypothetical protein
MFEDLQYEQRFLRRVQETQETVSGVVVGSRRPPSQHMYTEYSPSHPVPTRPNGGLE